MKFFYILAWFLLATAVLVSVLTGFINPLALLAFSLIAWSLVYVFALWAVFVNNPDLSEA
jgi:hypothetical protein